MDFDQALLLLSNYRDKKRGMLEASFVDATIEYIRSEVSQGRGSTALTEPSVASYVKKAQASNACGWTPFSCTISSNTITTTMPTPSTVKTITSEAPTKTSELLTLYCDGSCLNNGKRNAKAGYAIVAMRGGREEHRYAVPVSPDEPQTNQRAELKALDYAIRYLAKERKKGAIYTDSKYSIDCITKWASSWEKRGWKKAEGGPVLHLDIIKPLVGIYRELPGVTIHHVAAHTGKSDEHSLGNALVDQLARETVS